MEKQMFITMNKEKRKVTWLPFGYEGENNDSYKVNNQYFTKNGQPYLPIMGEFHFSRWKKEEWKQSLQKMKAGGIHIVATYVFWIHHEEKQGEWDFTNSRSLKEFLQVCKELNYPVWLRIGPWCHGECRNGGFPDWVVNQTEVELRTDNATYLKWIRAFFHKIGQEAKGMLWKDGGPILGIQIENEYGHCGGPSDENEGKKHLCTLKRIAKEEGIEAPFYTATGWGGGYVVDNEMLPVFGGYVDAPWANHTKESSASENFLFMPFRNDESIGSDHNSSKAQGYTFDINNNPYLTAELGGGLQVTAHRRCVPFPEDIEAQTVCMLGSGANLMGYYMYHGGVNPDGKYSTLQESKETGYPNDLPVKSYDFQTCIKESGEIGESYKRLKKWHLMIDALGKYLAKAEEYYPDRKPISPEDMETPRVCVRYDKDSGAGFLFYNNHQRLRHMTDKKVEVAIKGEYINETISLTLLSDDIGMIPFHLPLNNGRCILRKTNAQPITNIGKRYFFFTDEVPFYELEGEKDSVDIVTLTKEEANNCWKLQNKLLICKETLIEVGNEVHMLTTKETNKVFYYEEMGEKQEKILSTSITNPIVTAKLVKEGKKWAEYDIQIDNLYTENINECYLKIDFIGDNARLYVDDYLLTDWFTTGNQWNVALKRYGYPKKVRLVIEETKDNVYYDIKVEKGKRLNKVSGVVEKEIAVFDR